jgi:3D (Asp-Asp-Asp) domain-containing protein
LTPAAFASSLQNATPSTETEQQAEYAWLGDTANCHSGKSFMVEVTAYCACPLCCGKSDGITFSGRHARANHTIAVDPTVIPLGSEVYLEGLGTFTAEDVGGAIKGRRVDLFMDEHHQAVQFGVKTIKAHVLSEAV